MEHKRLENYPGFNEQFFYISSDELEENISFIKRNKIFNIGINKLKGFKSNDLYPIIELKDQVKKISIGRELDLSAISEFTNLEYLVSSSENASIDFSQLKKLKYLSFFYSRKMNGLESLENLETINVSKADEIFLSESIFCNYKKLHHLEIIQSKLPEEQGFLKCLVALKDLEFHYIKSRIDLKDLLAVKGSLEILKIGHSKNILSIDTLGKFKALKWLAIVDSVPLDSAAFVDELPALEVLVVLGSSYFVDGNIDNLKGKLRHVGIDDKRHYSLKSKDFKKA